MVREYFVDLNVNISWTENTGTGDEYHFSELTKEIIIDLAPPSITVSTIANNIVNNDYELEIPWGSKSNIAIVPTFIKEINSISKEHLETLLKVLFDVLVEIRKGNLKQIKGKKVAEYYNPQNNVSKFHNKTLLIPESSITIGYPGKENRKFFDSMNHKHTPSHKNLNIQNGVVNNGT